MGCSQSKSSAGAAVPPGRPSSTSRSSSGGGGSGKRKQPGGRNSAGAAGAGRGDAGDNDNFIASPPTIQRLSGPGPDLHRLIAASGDCSNFSGGGAASNGNVTVNGAAGSNGNAKEGSDAIWSRIANLVRTDPLAASFVDPDTGATPLHAACRNLDCCGDGGDDENDGAGQQQRQRCLSAVVTAVRALIKAGPDSLTKLDGAGNIPLHYALLVAPSAKRKPAASPSISWEVRAAVIEVLVENGNDACVDYLTRTDVVFDQPHPDTDMKKSNNSSEMSGGCTPLYHSIACLPDDFTPSPGPTVSFVRAVHLASPCMVTVNNASDHDKPLALLYRRFSRQFDLSEKFFPGDNSRAEVVGHRRRYKASAMNTWRIIQLLLRPAAGKEGGETAPTPASASDFKMVHAAVSVDCPPDLLRYIIETKPDQVQEQVDDGGSNYKGRLPLHCAAATVPPWDGVGKSSSFPAYHSKFVLDELLYAHPDGAAVRDGDGKLPLTLAVESGKTWIGGGVKSLYDVYPEAADEIDMERFPAIREAMSYSSQLEEQDAAAAADAADTANDDGAGAEGGKGGGSVTGLRAVKKEEHHDAIMLVQRADADLSDVVSAMWANEEDGGVQLLGCIAVTRLAAEAAAERRRRRGGGGEGGYSVDDDGEGEEGGDVDGDTDDGEVVAVALTSLTAVVNAMKNHPNEPAVQEKACGALLALSPADGRREVSFAASGAVASIVAAMQAHVSDAIVQREACAALRSIVRRGPGPDRATVIASVSGFTAIQNSLGAHPNDVGVQREACGALEVVTAFPDANLPELPGLQAAPLLQAAAEKFPDECKESADIVLSRLS